MEDNVWKKIEDFPPPKGVDILAFTDNDTQKVVRWTGKAFDTYLKVLYWRNLPEPPVKEAEPVTEKKTRAKKS